MPDGLGKVSEVLGRCQMIAGRCRMDENEPAAQAAGADPSSYGLGMKVC